MRVGRGRVPLGSDPTEPIPSDDMKGRIASRPPVANQRRASSQDDAPRETSRPPGEGSKFAPVSEMPSREAVITTDKPNRRSNARPSVPTRPPPRRPRSPYVAATLGFLAAATTAGAFVWAPGCKSQPPPGATSTDAPAHSATLTPPPVAPSAAPSPKVAESASVEEAPTKDAGAIDAGEAEKPYSGPLLGALMPQTLVYAAMDFKSRKLGYLRLGAKVPVEPKPLKDGSCPQGWFHLVDGGYVCGRHATTDMSNPQVKLGITPPLIEDVLPYKYASNAAHGTPLYRSVPSREEMIKYEPYLEAAKRAKRKRDRERDDEEPRATAEEDKAAPPDKEDKQRATAQAEAVGILDAGVSADDDGDAQKPWWQRQYEKGKGPDVKLTDLETESDSTIAKRMVKGFYVAIDKTFLWNNRTWYKTTIGLVAPADRMLVNKPPASQGIDVPAGVKQVGFITSGKASKYEYDDEKKKLKNVGMAARYSGFGLTGATVTVLNVVYRQTNEGWWMKAGDGTFTEPGPPPPDLAPGEKWVDVNLTRKTLLAFEGDKPVYAALVSPGKHNKVKAKDHATVKGTFRIREKHVTTTMDGDAAVAGDLPYSIEDVPYVSYFEGSYALHGAFWHSNFGHEMSHGCVNLSPLDAKKMFFWTEPKLPRGWHGVWATPENRGTVVITHE